MRFVLSALLIAIITLLCMEDDVKQKDPKGRTLPTGGPTADDMINRPGNGMHEQAARSQRNRAARARAKAGLDTPKKNLGDILKKTTFTDAGDKYELAIQRAKGGGKGAPAKPGQVVLKKSFSDESDLYNITIIKKK